MEFLSFQLVRNMCPVESFTFTGRTDVRLNRDNLRTGVLTDIVTKLNTAQLKGSWTRKRDIPTARGTLATAVVNNKIRSIGGWNGSALTTNEEYDPGSSEQVFYIHRKT